MNLDKKRRPIGKTIFILTMIFFYLPIFYVVVFSFNSSKSLTSFTGFSMQWYQKMLQANGMMTSLWVTIFVAIIATLISTFIGTITAIGLSQSRKSIRMIVKQMNDFPILNPEIVTAISMMILFVTFSINKGMFTLVLAHIAFCIPYVVLSIMPKLSSLDSNLAEAALDLGATPWQAMRKVIVPQIAPGIFAGALIAFTMSFDDFVISYFATGGGIKNLSIMVYTMSKRINPSINAISTIVILVIAVGLILVNVVPVLGRKLEKKNGEYAGINKKIKYSAIAFATAFVVFIGSFSFISLGGGEGKYKGQTLHIYNWGEYMGEDVIPTFEKYTGAKVIMDNFDSNEQMYIKIVNGEKYDVLVPSDYMIERLIKENRIQKLDKSKITAFDNILDSVKNLPYDPNNDYSVPYFWGNVGIVYDKTKVDVKDLEREGFNIFRDDKYKGETYLYDSERDSFMMALKALGYSMNTSNQKELDEAYKWLLDSVNKTHAEIVTDEIIDNMAQGRKALGIVYSGDAVYIMQENENMGFYVPESGTNVWSDAMVIPKDADNKELAYEFMNFVSDYESAMSNSSFVGYTSSNKEVFDELSSKDGMFAEIGAYIPRENHPNDEVFNYNEKTKKIMSELWSKVKLSASRNSKK
ncbi:MAG: extracellular solute-binding protein [Eubacteriales bacterium]|nr:extracellular solute-binding protein [Eubacteriales bacterium]MDY3332711.1 extracellular solute-binding protein [Gallibacter sp.]